MKNKEYTVRLNFLWDNENEIKEVKIVVPENISEEQLAEKLLEAHDFLCDKDEEDRYGVCGRNPETLLNYLCEQNKEWSWEELEYDIDFVFE